MIALGLAAAVVCLVTLAILRDVAIRFFADRADARVRRASEAEERIGRLEAEAATLGKRIAEVGKKLDTSLSARIRR